tara:strand:+ start:85767 stop:87146 length:1380 start_codon:yes stop_codon:yes gene_type:complete
MTALLSPGAVTAQASLDFNWNEINEEALGYFRDLIAINTTNPPGNETELANYLKNIFDREDVESSLYFLDPERANLVARINGNGSKKPILIMEHSDVVGVQAENWDTDPFVATERDGYIYGRGTLDDKDSITAALMVMLLLKRNNIELDRDIIFLAESGEEGTTKFGVDYMVENHWDKIESEFCLAEGGGAVSIDGEVKYVSITTTEKFPMRIKLVSNGEASHGSRPSKDNAILILSQALAKIGAWRSPMRLNDTTRAYFERLATIAPPDQAEWYRKILDVDTENEAQNYFEMNEPIHFSILRTSIAPTIVSGGFRRNVVPSTAEATIDIRGLPDESPEDFYKIIESLIDDDRVELIPEGVYRPASPPSSIENEMFQSLERTVEKMYPSAVTLPTMMTGATDMAQIRNMGVDCYGFGPLRTQSDINGPGGAHGDNERILKDSILGLVQFLWYTIIDISL